MRIEQTPRLAAGQRPLGRQTPYMDFMSGIVVWFDGSCPLCRREIALMRRLDRRGTITFVNAVEDAGICATSRADMLARLHAREDGQMLTGAAAFAAMWRAIPLLRPLGLLARSPHVLSLIERLYRVFLRARAMAADVGAPAGTSARRRMSPSSKTGRAWPGECLGLSAAGDRRTDRLATAHRPPRRNGRRHRPRGPHPGDEPPAHLLLPTGRRVREPPSTWPNSAPSASGRGGATYFDVDVGGHLMAAAAWSYPAPTPGFACLKNHVAFYAAPFEVCTVDGEQATPQPGGFYGGWITSRQAGPFKGVPGSRFW